MERLRDKYSIPGLRSGICACAFEGRLVSSIDISVKIVGIAQSSDVTVASIVACHGFLGCSQVHVLPELLGVANHTAVVSSDSIIRSERSRSVSRWGKEQAASLKRGQ